MSELPPVSDDTVHRLGPLMTPEGAALGLCIDARYEVRRRIGRGGMGEVFLCQDTKLDRPVAMKVLSADGASAVERFKTEIRALADADHPAIVPVYDFGTLPDGQLYFTMKYVPGRSLAQLLAHPDDRRALLAHLVTVADAVHFAHLRGVLHRDLKPSNIMVDDAGRAFVVDWGVARVAGRATPLSRLTADGTAIGTLAYMAPEQARGELDAVTERSDVYSLGAILHEILTGGPPSPSRSGDPTLPPELDAIRRQALAARPDERFATAHLLARALERHLRGDALPGRAAPRAQPSDTPATGAPAERVGRYVLRGLLGTGGMSRVFRAHDPSLNRDVALKVTVGVATPRAEREAHAMARLTHPNIAGVYDVGTAEGSLYLAMELIDGKPLSQAWADWPLRRRIEALRQAASAIAYAHARGVVHRDVKPENLMVAASGDVKVVDFGLALMEGDARLTRTNAVVGSPIYMAPEQIRGDQAGPPADVYSLGVILYEALAGVVPFLAATVEAVFRQTLTEEPVPPSRKRPVVPPDLETVCLHCLNKDATARYPSARELADDLANWLEDRAVRVRRSSALDRARRWLRRRAAFGAGLAAAAVLVALAAVWIAGVLRASEARGLADRAAAAYSRGDFDEARAHADAALRLAPGHRAARYWLGRLLLREYTRTRERPDVVISRGLLGVSPPSPETDAQRKLREEIVAAFRGGDEAFAAGVLAMWDGRAEEALARLDAVKGADAPEAAVFASRCLFVLLRFRDAESKLEPVRARDLPLWARVKLARAVESSLEGAEPASVFESAEKAAVAIEVAGDAREGLALQARAQIEWAVAEESRDLDPLPRLEKAIALAEKIDARVIRGDALLTKALHLATRGRIETTDPREFREAIDAYSRAIAQRPDGALGYVRRAAAARARWEYQLDFFEHAEADLKSALADYERACAFDDTHPEAALGALWARGALDRTDGSDLGRTCEALRVEISAIDALVARHPRSPHPLHRRAEVHGQVAYVRASMGQDADAILEMRASIADRTAAMALGPRSAVPLRARAGGLAWLGLKLSSSDRQQSLDLFAAAEADLAEARVVNPRDAENPRNLSRILRSMAGITHYNRGPEDIALRREALERALQASAEAAALRPLVGVIHVDHAYVLRDAGRYDDADAALERALKINPKLWDAWRLKSMIAQSRGSAHLDAALDHVRRALAISPGLRRRQANLLQQEASVLCSLGLGLGEKDPAAAVARLEEAVDTLTLAVEINPRNHDVRRFRANARLGLGVLGARKHSDPREHFKACIEDCQANLDDAPDHPRRAEWIDLQERARTALTAWERRHP